MLHNSTLQIWHLPPNQTLLTESQLYSFNFSLPFFSFFSDTPLSTVCLKVVFIWLLFGTQDVNFYLKWNKLSQLDYTTNCDRYVTFYIRLLSIFLIKCNMLYLYLFFIYNILYLFVRFFYVYLFLYSSLFFYIISISVFIISISGYETLLLRFI